jgi:hypothetical protein
MVPGNKITICLQFRRPQSIQNQTLGKMWLEHFKKDYSNLGDNGMDDDGILFRP